MFAIFGIRAGGAAEPWVGYSGVATMSERARQEGFWVFREGSGGDGAFHPTREAAEEAAGRMASGGMAVFVVPAVRFTTEAIEARRADDGS